MITDAWFGLVHLQHHYDHCGKKASMTGPQYQTQQYYNHQMSINHHITVALQTLHWLLVCQCITYKLCTLMHGVAFGYTSTYLLDAVVPVLILPGRTHLWSADSGLYDVPWVSSSVGSTAFSIAGPQAWNQLPTSIRQMGLHRGVQAPSKN